MTLPDPYYSDDLVTLYHADARDILPHLGPVDLIHADPPYSVSSTVPIVRKPGKGTHRFDFFEVDLDWSAMRDTVLEIVALAAPLAPSVYVWCGHRQFGHLVELFEANGWKTRPIVWRKKVPIPAPPGVGWDSALELCVYAFRSGRKWTPPTGTKVPNVIDADSYRHGQPGKVDHPTQKPIVTASRPIEYSTDPGDLVLEPFAGSGTTLVAAKRLGRRVIGIELEEAYCEIAAKRLAQGVLTFDEQEPRS